MKNFFSKPTGKRLILGLLLIALAVVLGIIMDDKFTGPDSMMLHRLIFIVCVIGLGLGGLAFIFFSWWGLLLSVGLVLVIALPQALPDPWNRYFSFLYLASLLGIRPLIDWFKKQKKASPQKATATQEKSRRTKLRQLRTGLTIAIGAIALPWMFLDVPYKLFSALSLLPFSVALATICLFPDDIALDGNKSQKAGGRVDFFLPLAFSGFAPALRTLFDFNFLTWKPFLIQSAILLVLIAALLLVYYKELRHRIGYLLCLLFMCTFFCIGAVGQLNYLLDTSEPQRQTATVTDMHISTSSKSPDRYVLTVITLSGTEMELQTSKEHYNSLSIGENVTVYIKEGGLGIPYAIAD